MNACITSASKECDICHFWYFLNYSFNPLSTNFTKLSNTLKQFVGKLLTNCLSVFDHFVGLALKGLSFIEVSPLGVLIYQ